MKEPNTQPHLDLAAVRIDYAKRSLDERDVDPDPIRQLIAWIDQAIAARVNEPNAMTLATCEDGRPSARVMLLKNVDADGLSFFTNYLSRKGRQMAANPQVAAVMWWPELERQVRIEGTVSRTTIEESRDYFAKRPPDARLGAVASPQSEIVESRRQLEGRMAELRHQYPDGNIPCPEHWGGFRLRPRRMEFWQGRPSRLHDRIEYLRENNAWTIRRLAP